MAETEVLINNSQSSPLNRVYERYKDEVRQKVLGIIDQSEISRGIMSGEISQKQLDRIKIETSSFEKFESFCLSFQDNSNAKIVKVLAGNNIVIKGDDGHIYLYEKQPNGSHLKSLIK
jgi:hypothetical protein